VKLAKALNADKRQSVEEICHTLGMSRTTFYRYMKK
jgi:predicted DNA-binding transcriptional regulator AlpA